MFAQRLKMLGLSLGGLLSVKMDQSQDVERAGDFLVLTPVQTRSKRQRFADHYAGSK